MTSLATTLSTDLPSAATAPATAARGRHRVERRSWASRLLSLVTTLGLVAGIAALLFMTVGPRVFHYRTATMLTGSMSPGINPGDIVLDTEEPTKDIAIGQIITYHIPIDDHHVESHRVVWLRHNADGSVSFRTKGDANADPDPWTARASTPTVWQVRAVVPFVGKAIQTLRTPAVHIAMVIVAPAVLILWLLVAIWRPAKPEGDESEATENSGGKQDRDGGPAARGVVEMQGAGVGGDDARTGGQA